MNRQEAIDLIGEYTERARAFTRDQVITGLAERFPENGSKNKAMRWLGFVQGCLYVLGARSLEDLKEDARTRTTTRPGHDVPDAWKKRPGRARKRPNTLREGLRAAKEMLDGRLRFCRPGDTKDSMLILSKMLGEMSRPPRTPEELRAARPGMRTADADGFGTTWWDPEGHHVDAKISSASRTDWDSTEGTAIDESKLDEEHGSACKIHDLRNCWECEDGK